MREMGQTVPDSAYRKATVMGRVFDPAQPDAYLDGFAIKRT
jgi:nitrate/nitrite transport system substrate-binding protein